MFRQITTILTLAAMLWHAALGCWWHHAHGAQHAWSCIKEETCQSGGKGCPSHQPPGEDAAAHSRPAAAEEPLAASDAQTRDRHRDGQDSHPDQCLEGQCKYLRASQPHRLRPVRAELWAPSFDVAAVWAVFFGVVGNKISLPDTCDALPYLPRCETTQVWRI